MFSESKSEKKIELYAENGLIYTVLTEADGGICRAGIYNPKGTLALGDIYFGRVLKSLPALSGAFVLLEGGAEGFLPYRKNLAVQEGDFIAVAIIREAQHGKGVRLRLAPDFKIPENIKQQKKPCCLHRGKSLPELWAEEFPEAEIISPHPETALCLPKERRSRFRIDYASFDSQMKEDFEALGDSDLSLGNGICAKIERMQALTAIDLDAPQGAGFEENRRAIETLLHEIELRQMGGVILIDPAGLPAKKRFALTKFIQAYVQKTKNLSEIQVLGATPSGMIELSVPRKRKSLMEILGA